MIGQCRMLVKEGKNCNDQLYQCKECKSVGCKNWHDSCRNQAFDGQRCLRCGKTNATC